ncbi:unnamed protein product [Arabidopsis thaliana]|uniref:Transmembrane protein n=1 Tax=Arabidopsis thaliana TaxID=3702 RepID=A0A5S9Y7Y6_ARATH|nr:unnamed protein product [Arabidopsis thaliana]
MVVATMVMVAAMVMMVAVTTAVGMMMMMVVVVVTVVMATLAPLFLYHLFIFHDSLQRNMRRSTQFQNHKFLLSNWESF